MTHYGPEDVPDREMTPPVEEPEELCELCGECFAFCNCFLDTDDDDCDCTCP